MKLLSKDIVKGRSIYFLIAVGLIPVVYIVFLLVLNYQNNLALQESFAKRFKLDTEKQAATLGYFFLERKHDIRTMAGSPEVMTYLINRDMGMSEQYGLRVSLFSIHQLMLRTLHDDVIKTDSIYKNFAFINLDKKILANGTPQVTKFLGSQWQSELNTVKNGPELIIEETESGYELLLASPCFYKRKLSGWLVAFLNLDTLSKHFLGPNMQLFSNLLDPIHREIGFEYLVNQRSGEFPWKNFKEGSSDLYGENLVLVNDDIHKKPPVLLLPVQIQSLNLFLAAYVPKKEILGSIEIWQYLAGTSGLIFLFLIGSLMFVQTDTKHLILKVRFDEAQKQQALLTKKNAQLEKEINKREKAEQILKESEERYRKLFESSGDAILIVVDNKISACNRKTTELLELDYDKIIDRFLYNFSPLQQTDGSLSKERYLKLIDKAVETPQDSEWLLLTENNQLIETEISMTALSLSSGTYTQVIIRDITLRKKAEEEKMQAQKIASEQKKLALVGQVAGKMAHDFNNVLGIIMGHSEISLLTCEDDQTRETLDLIFKQTLRGRNLTKNLVAFAKSQEPKQEFLIINERIDLALNLMKKDLENIALLIDKSSDIPELLADSGMIEHALVNIIQNSIHALSLTENPKIIIRTYYADDCIGLEIDDNGCGISGENLERIFEPSFTLKGTKDTTGSYDAEIKGTGYGMANVKKYIEQHKGTISVESEYNKGTKITIQLPVTKRDLTTREKTVIRKEITQCNKHILLVEDETALSEIQYRVLTGAPCSHKVDIAVNGTVAMDLFDRNNYDFVSLDYILPGGITGMDVYRHVRKRNKTLPILFVSGNIEFLESIKFLKKGDPFVDHVSKPCQNKNYVSSINRLLEIATLN